jgi:spore germination protein
LNWRLTFALLLFACLAFNVQRSTFNAAAPLSADPAPFVVAGWLPEWDWPNAWATLTGNLNVLDEISPFWYEMQADGSVLLYPGAHVAEVLAAARTADRPVIPTINNDFDPVRVNAVINDPGLRAIHVSNVVAEVMSRGYVGIDIDYENLYPTDRDAFSAFVAELAGALHAQGRVLTIAVHPKTSEPGEYNLSKAHDYAALGAVVDELRVMTYDWSWSGGVPGPIAPYWWVEDVIEFAKTQVDPARIMVGVHFYAYDWPASAPHPPPLSQGEKGAAGVPRRDVPPSPFAPASSPEVPQAATARTWRDVRDLIVTYQPTVEWRESDSRGPVREHWFTYSGRSVWFADHDSVAARRELAQRLGVRGIAIWRLGSEDPANWAALDTRACRADVNRDGRYDIRDVMSVSRAWSSAAGDPDYAPYADLNADGQVDATDVQQAAAAWLWGCQ